MGIQALADKFEGARGALFAAPLAAALSLGGLAASANDAYAQDAGAQPVAVEQINVPWRDAQNATRDGIQSLAAIASNEAQTIVLYAPTREIWDQVIAGAKQQLSTGETALNGIILASGETPEVAFYADAQLTETILRPDTETLSQAVENTLKQDYFEHIKAQQIAQIDLAPD